MHISIQKRLLFYILSITTLFLVGIGLVNYWWAEDVVVSVSEKRAETMSDDAAHMIESYLLQKGQIAWTMAQDENIHDFVIGLESRYQDMSDNEDYGKLLTTLKRIVTEDPDINIAYIAIEKTERIYDSMEYDNPPDYLVNSRPWYNAAVNARGLVFSSPYICPVSGKRVVSAAFPFYDQQGNLLGVAAVEILADKIQNIVSGVHLFDSGYSFMLDANENVIAYPSKNHLNMIERSLGSKNLGIGKAVDSMINGQTGSEQFQTDGIAKYVFYTPIKEVGWSLGVVVPKAEIQAALDPLARFSFITVLLGLLIITFIIIVLTSRITKPLEEFTQVMKKVGDGDYTVRARVDGQDEVGKLGENLNQMLDKQQHLIEKVISIAYNMGVVGNELAITIGEGKATIPWVTSEISAIMGKMNLNEMLEKGVGERSANVKTIFEQIILFNYVSRSMLGTMNEIENEVRCAQAGNDNEFYPLCESIEKQMFKMGEQIDNVCQMAESIQLDYVDVSDYVDGLTQYLGDIFNTLRGVNDQVNKIGSMQFEMLERASMTSAGLVEWSQSLMELTSRFHIGPWPHSQDK